MLKKELKKELNRTKLILDYAREEIKVKDKEIKQLKSQLQQKANIIKEAREHLQETINIWEDYEQFYEVVVEDKCILKILDKEVN